jgi:hypothetical protein
MHIGFGILEAQRQARGYTTCLNYEAAYFIIFINDYKNQRLKSI